MRLHAFRPVGTQVFEDFHVYMDSLGDAIVREDGARRYRQIYHDLLATGDLHDLSALCANDAETTHPRETRRLVSASDGGQVRAAASWRANP